MTRSVSDLQQAVEAELQWDPGVDQTGIEVRVDRGVVVLEGRVISHAQRDAAERAAKRVRGVTALANELRVELPPDQVRDDVALAQAATQALRWHSVVPDGIRVTVSKGWVTLEGEVESGFQRRTAAALMRDLRGVRGVHDLIAVRPACEARDVRRALGAALHRYASLEAAKVDAEVAAGKVTLRGHVGSWTEKAMVEDAAWSAPGVREVDNRLQIEA